MTENPWKTQALVHAGMYGDIPQAESALVQAEYERLVDRKFECPCGGVAHVHAAVGAHRCVSCRSLTHDGVRWF